MKKITLLLIMTGLINWLIGCKGQIDKRDFQDDKFKVGQIWKYKTRIGEENSTITILKVEKYDVDGIVIHIHVNGLKLKNPHKLNGFSDNIGHLPLSKDAMLNSVTTLVSENNNLPDFIDGYNNWKEAFDNDKGGVFSIEVGDAVKYVEETMNTGQKRRN